MWLFLVTSESLSHLLGFFWLAVNKVQLSLGTWLVSMPSMTSSILVQQQCVWGLGECIPAFLLFPPFFFWRSHLLALHQRLPGTPPPPPTKGLEQSSSSCIVCTQRADVMPADVIVCFVGSPWKPGRWGACRWCQRRMRCRRKVHFACSSPGKPPSSKKPNQNKTPPPKRNGGGEKWCLKKPAIEQGRHELPSLKKWLLPPRSDPFPNLF